jgi:hypothetical protein
VQELYLELQLHPIVCQAHMIGQRTIGFLMTEVVRDVGEESPPWP